MTLRQFLDLKETVERLQREEDRAAGALEQIDKQLREGFDCESDARARKLLAQLTREERDAEAGYEKAWKAFQSGWGAKL